MSQKARTIFAIQYFFTDYLKYKHCIKSDRIRSYSGPYFPALGLNVDQNNSEYEHFPLSENRK